MKLTRFSFLTKRKKTILVLVVLVVVVYLVWSLFFKKENGYTMGLVQRQTIIETITESGSVTTNGRVNIYSPTNGVISEVFVTNGEVVKEGQKLFSVKSTATPQEKASAFSTYKAAASAVQEAENNRRKTAATVARVYDDLKNKGNSETYTEKETRTSAEVAHDNAYDALLSAQASLVSSEIAYRATQNATVTAPISGTIANLAVVSGVNVLANSALAPTSAVLILNNLGDTEVAIALGEGDINKLKVGQEASIKLDAIEQKTYKGVVSRFDSHGVAVSGVIKFNVYISITDFDDSIRPGMTADVDIVVNELKDVLAVPNVAVKPYQKGRAVRTLGIGDKLEYTPVKVGVRGKEYTQITEGVVEGQEIVVSLLEEQKEKKGPFGF